MIGVDVWSQVVVEVSCRKSGRLQPQTVTGAKMALTSQGTKKKVCYYYDGKKLGIEAQDHIFTSTAMKISIFLSLQVDFLQIVFFRFSIGLIVSPV